VKILALGIGRPILRVASIWHYQALDCIPSILFAFLLSRLRERCYHLYIMLCLLF